MLHASRGAIRGIVVALPLLSQAPSALATVITFALDGLVTSVTPQTAKSDLPPFGPGPFASLSVGDAIRATITYDSGAPYFYNPPVVSGYPVAMSFIGENGAFGLGTTFAQFNPRGASLVAPVQNRYANLASMGGGLQMSFGNIWINGLPPTAFDLTYFVGASMWGTYAQNSSFLPAQIGASFTSMSVVPLPGAAWLFAGALVALACFRRWNTSPRRQPLAARPMQALVRPAPGECRAPRKGAGAH